MWIRAIGTRRFVRRSRPSPLGRWLAASLAVGLSGCGSASNAPQPSLLGALGGVAPYATDAQRATFDRGRELVQHRFTFGEGLGPHYNLVFCGGCHERPTFGGSAGRYRDFLLVAQALPDGSQVSTGVNGVQPQFDQRTGRFPDDPDTTLVAKRNPPPFFGVGLLAEISEAEILSRIDPDDRDGDGISGRANYDLGFVGRFGRKAQTVSIEGFIRGPLFNHLGITSDPLSEADKARLPVPSASASMPGRIIAAQVAAPAEPIVDNDAIPDPELSPEQLFDLVSFAMLLAGPSPDPVDPEGQARFSALGCDGCHVPALRGPRGPVAAYTDLLLHDMGEAMADGIRMGEASGREFRTQPLWGVTATGPYLHDGRADTLEEAILAHGGEADAARQRYAELDRRGRDEVLDFVRSLGGRAEATPGLLPPDAPPPPAGAPGGPTEAMPEAMQARFERGRALFDRDMTYASGLGPRFNGDSCRGCHFEPVVGGAGPLDVNVVRQGARQGMGGGSQVPAEGSMVHRFDRGAMRPRAAPTADFFELRQTPSILGLGLVEQIPESAILAHDDPGDRDGDGISGRAHRLADGRLGRFGWKANVPSLREFAADALLNEVGITVPAEAEVTLGAARDDDEAPDPELGLDEFTDLVFYLEHLAPPPRDGNADQARGEEAFERVGCADCHRPLALPGGQVVPLYSDLLLHDVMAPDAVGIPEGDAEGREFRTPPLWGIRDTAPYLHDGAASTLEQAITAHQGEAQAATTAYRALSAGDREALLAFLRSL